MESEKPEKSTEQEILNEIENQKIKITTVNNVYDILKLHPEADQKQLEKMKKDFLSDIEDAKNGNRMILGAKYGDENSIVGII